MSGTWRRVRRHEYGVGLRGCPGGGEADPRPAEDVETPFRIRACRYCNGPFFICRSCDRGHAYCSEPCRRQGYARRRRQARARHEQSPEGRLDHRDRQRAYRERWRARVTDPTSPTPEPSVYVSPPVFTPRIVAREETRDALTPVYCCICQRQGLVGTPGGVVEPAGAPLSIASPPQEIDAD